MSGHSSATIALHFCRMLRLLLVLRLALWLFAICFAAATMAGLIWFEADPARTLKVTTYYDVPNPITHKDD